MTLIRLVICLFAIGIGLSLATPTYLTHLKLLLPHLRTTVHHHHHVKHVPVLPLDIPILKKLYIENGWPTNTWKLPTINEAVWNNVATVPVAPISTVGAIDTGVPVDHVDTVVPQTVVQR